MVRKNLDCILFASFLLVNSPAYSQNSQINRFELVNRHNVEIDKVDPMCPLSVGNGDFAFTVDVTGLQTFGDFYYKNGVSLETLSNWAGITSRIRKTSPRKS